MNQEVVGVIFLILTALLLFAFVGWAIKEAKRMKYKK
jgi:hypothetical protein|tara:strand:- start:12842 stop:12952 length:111 start_codon:yes stop_codon:yes gene_type:complete